MATLLGSHLEQISLCATSIGDLSFPGPKSFTNALLSRDHDITALIRDTEQHERALFHLAPPPLPKGGVASEPSPFQTPAKAAANRRRTIRYEPRQPKARAVAAVLGGDLYLQTRRTEASDRQKGDVDVELLLKGAEKLLAVYPNSRASERIAQQRRRYQQLSANIAHYEARVAEQVRELHSKNRPTDHLDQSELIDDGERVDLEEADPVVDTTTILAFSKEELEQEEQQIQDLERKKKLLEDRVEGMERDLGGLMR